MTVAKLKLMLEKQQKRLAQQEKQIAVLTSGLEKVSAQRQISKAASQTVLNNH